MPDMDFKFNNNRLLLSRYANSRNRDLSSMN